MSVLKWYVLGAEQSSNQAWIVHRQGFNPDEHSSSQGRTFWDLKLEKQWNSQVNQKISILTIWTNNLPYS